MARDVFDREIGGPGVSVFPVEPEACAWGSGESVVAHAQDTGCRGSDTRF